MINENRKEKLAFYLNKFGIFLLLVLHFILSLPYINFVPIWDGYMYLDVLSCVIESPFHSANSALRLKYVNDKTRSDPDTKISVKTIELLG